MSCILRIWGEKFNPETAVSGPIKPDKIWHTGEKRFPQSEKILTVNKSSGVNFEISNAEFFELEIQIEEATIFFNTHCNWISQLTSSLGVEGAIADFGADIAPPFWASYSFPPSLLSALGKANVTLGLSLYPNDDDENDANA